MDQNIKGSNGVPKARIEAGTHGATNKGQNGNYNGSRDQRTMKSSGIPKVEASIGNYGTAIRRWMGIQDGTST